MKTLQTKNGYTTFIGNRSGLSVFVTHTDRDVSRREALELYKKCVEEKNKTP